MQQQPPSYFDDIPLMEDPFAIAPPPPLDLSVLNASQLAAVETTEGPLLVLAGAGTGKTRVLTTRIAYIMQQGLAFPSNILAVTFTNKASKEMQSRIASMAGDQASGLWLGTFHSICLRILRRHAEELGYARDFTIIDTDDQVRLLKQILVEKNIDPKQMPPKMLVDIIGRWKDQALPPAKAAEQGAEGQHLDIYKAYQQRLKQLGVMDFGDLILHCITLFTSNATILAEYHRRFKYLLVDEYQDTNVAQYLWLRLLATANHNICCVGDDDQSIYGWRGAEVDNILKFDKDFDGATVVRLEDNYRSTPEILAAAGALIANNESRLGKTLRSQLPAGEKVKLVSLWDDKSEAKYIAGEIESFQKMKRISLEEMAILVRAGYQTRAFEERFIAEGIPYRIIGGLRFYERMEIRDAISYVRAVWQQTNDLALERIINLPKRGLGGKTIDGLRTYARERNIPMLAGIREQVDAKSFKPKVQAVLSQIVDNFDRWRTLFDDTAHDVVVDTILKESGYIDMWKNDKTPEAPGRVENLKELISALSEFENIEQFLEHVSLVSDGDKAPDGEMVNVMTMHGSKGLEFEVVFLGGWEEGLFPSQRSMDESGTKGLEEERRLAYVGMTRAKHYLTICFVSSRYTFGQNISSIPSRFIDELPEDSIERVNTTGAGYRGNQTQKSMIFAERHSSGFQKTGNRSAGGHAENGHSKQSTGGFDLHQRIFHTKFGYGKIIHINGKNLKISFEKGSVRTLMEDYVEGA
jgi:DNA helicase-2/ATP-dependent DNA helicase PcrA